MSLIGVVWKLRDRELVAVVADMKTVLQNQARMMSQLEQNQRETTGMAGHANRITAIDGDIKAMYGRLDRHGDDIDTINKRIDFLQSLINHNPRPPGDA